jgi:hypothetical protein
LKAFTGFKLSVGVALIILLSTFMGTTLFPDDERIIASANTMTEAISFFSEYPDGKVEVDRTGMYGNPLIVYHFEKTYANGEITEVSRLTACM